jgi:hypothetical protein
LDFRYSDSDGVNEWPFAQIAVPKQVDVFVRSAVRLWLNRGLRREPHQERVQRLAPIRLAPIREKSRPPFIRCLRLPEPLA